MNNNEKQIHLCMILALAMAGCSPASSIVGDAEKTFRTVVESESKGQIKLVTFAKKDGRKLEVMGVKGYELVYEAEIKFESDGTWITSPTIESGIGFNFDVLSGPRLKSITADLMNSALGGKPVNRGDHAKISGKMMGEEYESGWKFKIREGEATLVAASPGSTSAPETKKSEGSAAQKTPVGKKQLAKSVLYDTWKNEDEINNRQEKTVRVGLDLLMIDTAKATWALENRKRDTDIPTEEDLKGSFSVNGFPKHPAGGRFVINAIGRPAESTQYGTSKEARETEAKIYSETIKPMLAALYAKREALPKEAKDALECYRNLGLIYKAVQSSGGQLPSQLLTLQEQLKQRDGSADVLVCPADPKRPVIPLDWSTISASNISYEVRAPGARLPPNSTSHNFRPTAPGVSLKDVLPTPTCLLRCPIHGLLICSDGKIYFDDDLPSEVAKPDTSPARKIPVGIRQLAKSVLYDTWKTEDDIHNARFNIGSVVATLRRIEGAKVTWALEHKKQNTDIPTEEDIKSYLDEFPKHPPGGRFVINAVGRDAESTEYGTEAQANTKLASVTSEIVNPMRSAAFAKQEALPKEAKDALKCLRNLGSIYNAVHRSGGQLPSQLLTLKEQLKQEDGSADVLVCPADPKRPLSLLDWSTISSANISYEVRAPGARLPPNSTSTQVRPAAPGVSLKDVLPKPTCFLRCPIHGLLICSDEKIYSDEDPR